MSVIHNFLLGFILFLLKTASVKSQGVVGSSCGGDGFCNMACGSGEGITDGMCNEGLICCLVGGIGAACGPVEANDGTTCRNNSCEATEAIITTKFCTSNFICCQEGAEGAQCETNGICKTGCSTTDGIASSTCATNIPCCVPGNFNAVCGDGGVCKVNCPSTDAPADGFCAGSVLKCCTPGSEGSTCGDGDDGMCKASCEATEGSIISTCQENLTCCSPGSAGAACGINNVGWCNGTCENDTVSIMGDCKDGLSCCTSGAGTSCTYYIGFYRRAGICRDRTDCPPMPIVPRRRGRGVGLRRTRRTVRPRSPAFGSPCPINAAFVCC